MIREKYPKSFRPYLSMTMLQAGEPQGLLRGLVSPKQIKRVWYNKEWHTRKEFIDLGVEIQEGPYDPKRKVEDFGVDMSSPKYKLSDVFKFSAKILGYPLDTIIEVFQRRAKRGRAEIEKILEDIGWDRKAMQVYTDQVMKRFATETAK